MREGSGRVAEIVRKDVPDKMREIIDGPGGGAAGELKAVLAGGPTGGFLPPAALDTPLTSVFGTLQAYLGSTYVNDFNRFGRTYQVRVQADHEFRVEPDDIKQLDVRYSAASHE